MAIDSIDKLIKGLAESSKLRFFKPTLAGRTAADITSLWKINGFPSIGATPTTSTYCDLNTVGSWVLPSLQPGNKMYMGKLSGTSSSIGQLMVFDRLSHMAGLSGTETGAQTVNIDVSQAALTGRCETDGTGVLWCVEVYAVLGGTARTLTVTYTNESDVNSRTTTVAIRANAPASLVLPIVPNTSDLRIKSIQSVQLNASTGTVGNFGITARKRMAELPIPIVGVGRVADYASLAMPELVGVECLELLYSCQTTSTGLIQGSTEIMQG